MAVPRHSHPSWPALCRPSTSSERSGSPDVDPRDKPADDGGGWRKAGEDELRQFCSGRLVLSVASISSNAALGAVHPPLDDTETPFDDITSNHPAMQVASDGRTAVRKTNLPTVSPDSRARWACATSVNAKDRTRGT